MQILILSILIFLLIGGVISAVVINSQKEKRKRLMQVVKGDANADGSAMKLSIKEQRRSKIQKKLNNAGEDEKEKKKKDTVTIKEKIIQSGMNISVQQFWIGSVISCVVLFFAFKLAGASTFVTIMGGIIGLFGLPRFFLRHKTKKRQKAFMKDFPDALDSMMRLLQAGMPVSEAIKMVAREFEGPMSEEMGRVFDEQKIGIPLPEAVLNAAKRMPLTEMKMFATAIAIQTQTGSSLSEVLQNLSSVIRARFKLARKVKSLSSEAKASAGIIAALPVFVCLGLYLVNRPYIEVMFITDTGKFLLGCAVAWMGVGCLVMRQMINFKV